MMEEISVLQMQGICIGQGQDIEAATGCTVFLSADGMRAGLDVRGGGPASRESELLRPMAAADKIHSVVLAGGSAYGLNAAGGVMQWLKEKDIGFDVGVTKVPLVCQSDLFDLKVGSCDRYPDARMGYLAAKAAWEGGNYRDGNYGAGCGATVGKWNGMETCMKSGIGSYAVRIGKLEVGAVVAVNALGDVYDWKDGHRVAGMLNKERTGFADTEKCMLENIERIENKLAGNTTIGVVITNADFDKTRLCKIAGMAQDGVARAIRPVHTSADGDSIYALSVGQMNADQDIVGEIGAQVVSEAILRAVNACEDAYGFLCAKRFR